MRKCISAWKSVPIQYISTIIRCIHHFACIFFFTDIQQFLSKYDLNEKSIHDLKHLIIIYIYIYECLQNFYYYYYYHYICKILLSFNVLKSVLKISFPSNVRFFELLKHRNKPNVSIFLYVQLSIGWNNARNNTYIIYYLNLSFYFVFIERTKCIRLQYIVYCLVIQCLKKTLDNQCQINIKY